MDSNINNLRIKDIIKDTNLSTSELSTEERTILSETGASYLTNSDISYITQELKEKRQREMIFDIGLAENYKKQFLRHLSITESLIDKTPNYTLQEYAKFRTYSKFYSSITSKFSYFKYGYRLSRNYKPSEIIKTIAICTFLITLPIVILGICIFFFLNRELVFSTVQGNYVLKRIIILLISLFLMLINLIHFIYKSDL